MSKSRDERDASENIMPGFCCCFNKQVSPFFSAFILGINVSNDDAAACGGGGSARCPPPPEQGEGGGGGGG